MNAIKKAALTTVAIKDVITVSAPIVYIQHPEMKGTGQYFNQDIISRIRPVVIIGDPTI